GIILLVFFVIFGGMELQVRNVGGGVAVGFLGLVALVCLWFRTDTVLSDADHRVTHRTGFFPFVNTREIHYTDFEKMTISGRSRVSNSGAASAQYDLRLWIRGNSKPLWVASYDEQGIRRNDGIIRAVSSA